MHGLLIDNSCKLPKMKSHSMKFTQKCQLIFKASPGNLAESKASFFTCLRLKSRRTMIWPRLLFLCQTVTSVLSNVKYNLIEEKSKVLYVFEYLFIRTWMMENSLEPNSALKWLRIFQWYYNLYIYIFCHMASAVKSKSFHRSNEAHSIFHNNDEHLKESQHCCESTIS